jgi:hypothetical protein
MLAEPTAKHGAFRDVCAIYNKIPVRYRYSDPGRLGSDYALDNPALLRPERSHQLLQIFFRKCWGEVGPPLEELALVLERSRGRTTGLRDRSQLPRHLRRRAVRDRLQRFNHGAIARGRGGLRALHVRQQPDLGPRLDRLCALGEQGRRGPDIIRTQAGGVIPGLIPTSIIGG